MQASDKQLDFKAPWGHVRWLKDSCKPQELPAGAVLDEDCGTANGHVEALHALADRDIQRLIIPHGALPARLTVLLPLLGWYQGELAAFRFNTIRDQMLAVLNLAELQKTHVLRHWQLVGIPLAQHNLHQQDALNIANCHLCDGQFRYLYVIKVEEGHEEKELFATALNKYQLEADRVIGGVGAKRAVDLFRDTLRNSGVCVCMACAVPVLGARLRRRETGAATPVSGESQGDSTVPTGTVTIAHAPEALVLQDAGEKETEDTCSADRGTEHRRSPRKCRAPKRFSPECVDKAHTATAEREILRLERRAVTAELRAIGLAPDEKRTLLSRVPASVANKLLASFCRDQPFMVGHTFWHYDLILQDGGRSEY